MESKDPDENCNTETEEETIALMRKRARRVSFAETTAVHFFDRDEESDKKATATEAADDDWLRRSESDEIRALLQASGVSADEEGEEDDDGVPLTARKSFFRPIDSPSPASSTFGSATSNDEDNFFGPISADFIKRGLSNSAGDDENHDITMDSATFSMHFRSLAKSDSGEVRTPTGFRLAFGENSQTETAKSTLGNSMVLTMEKTPIAQSSPDAQKITASCDSSDMSLVTESLDRYDYGRLSPGLHELLAEGQKDVVAVSLSTQLEDSILNDYPQEGSEFDGIYQNCSPLHTKGHTPTIPTDLESPCHADEEKTNMPYAQTPSSQRMQNISSYEECSPMSGKLNIGTNPTQMEEVFAGQESIRTSEKTRKRKAEFGQRDTKSDLNSENQVEPLLTGSISSLNAKRRHIFKDLTSSSDHHWNSAFQQKQPGSCYNKGHDRIICSLPPLPGKSISRLKWLKASPLASLYNSGVKHSELTLSGSLSRSSSKNNTLDVPVARLEEQFSSASRDCETKNMNDSDVHMLDQTVGTRLSLSFENGSEDDRPTIPASDFTSSEEGMVEVTLNDRKYVKPAISESPKQFTILPETPTQNYTGNMRKEGHSIATPNSALHASSVTKEKCVPSQCTNYGSSHLETPKQHYRFILSEAGKLIANVKETESSTPATEDPGLLIDRDISTSGLLSKLNDASEIPASNFTNSEEEVVELTLNDRKYVKPAISESPKQFTTVSETPTQNYIGSTRKEVHSIATPNSALHASSVTKEKCVPSQCTNYGSSHLKTPKQLYRSILHEAGKLIANVKEAESSTPATEDPGLLTGRDISTSGLFSKLNDASEIGTIGQNTVLNNIKLNGLTPVRHGQSEQHFSNSVKSIRTASRKAIVGDGLPAISKDYRQDQYIHSSMEQQCSSAHDNAVLELRRKDGLTLDSNKLGLENACSNVQNAFDICDENYSSKIKNLSGKLGADMEEAVDILHTHQHFLNDYNQSVDTIPQNLTDVFKKFNLRIEERFSSSVVKLDTHVVVILEDIMSNLQKFAASKIISSEIHSQKMSEEYNHAHLKRVAETKLLMYKILYGKVKMQLMHLKKKKLLNQIELLQSSVQESKVLKSKCCCKMQGSTHQDRVGGGTNSQFYITGPDENKDTGKSISLLKKALDDSERKIENLIGSFHTSLNMAGQPNCNMTVAIVLDHYKRKAPCWLLHHEFQLWEVENTKIKKGHLDVLLNYDEIVSQRFILKRKPKPSISISTEIINTRISKIWPRTNTSVAFEFTLSDSTAMKYTGPVVFARETQRISSLLSNLCDVLEEIKLAQIELSNMTKSNFHLQSVGRLILQLTFINFSDGKILVLSFDMSCLSCGVYPSDITPYEVGDGTSEKQNLISQSMVNEVKSSIGGLRCGYSRILRLCRCVSHVLIQAGSCRR